MKKKTQRLLCLLTVLTLLAGILPLPAAAADTAGVGRLADFFTPLEETFTLRPDTRLFLAGDTIPGDELLRTARLIRQQFAALGTPVSVEPELVWGREAWARAGDIVLKLDAAAGLADDAYRVRAGAKTTITACNTRGLLYGANMLMKHLRCAGTASIPGFCAENTPDTAERTVHLDMARKYFTKDWICNFIRQLSWMGYNALELHFSEDGGFRIDIWDPQYFTSPTGNDFSWIVGSETPYWVKNCPDPDTGRYLSCRELIEILEVAGQYQIDVIPSFDTPAHVDWLTKNYGRYHQGKTFQYAGTTYTLPGRIHYRQTGRSADYACLDLGNETVRKFAFALYEDLAVFFRQYAHSTHFNIGGDEVALKASGSWNYGDYVNYINDLNALLKEQGYTVRMFNDFVYRQDYTDACGEAVSMPDGDLEFVYWDAPNGSSGIRPAQYLIERGHRVYSGVQNWTYHVLRIANTSGVSPAHQNKDARDPTNTWWSFYRNGEDSIYTEWNPARLSEYGAEQYHYAGPALAGGYFFLWNDYAGVNTEQELWNGVWDRSGSANDGRYFYSLFDRMWSASIKMWSWDLESRVNFEDFSILRDSLGLFPGMGSGWNDCSAPVVLPGAGAAAALALDESVWSAWLPEGSGASVQAICRTAWNTAKNLKL